MADWKNRGISGIDKIIAEKVSHSFTWFLVGFLLL
jgi:hypothetical protein